MTLHPDTIAVHAGAEHPDPATKAQATPLHQSVAFVFDDAQYAADLFDLKTAGHIYGRISNPTQDVFETRISALEGGVGTLATSSGMSAILLAILNLARAGDNFVALETLYGGSVTLFTHTLAELGIEARFVPPDRPDKLAALVDDHTRLLFAETIANPAITVPDLDAWGEAAHACDIPLVVDNTIATPILCRPLDHGADLVVHSTTKYIGGHGTSVGGAIVDGGRFDWAAHAERFPTMIEPDTSYHGVVWTDAFGPAAYITRARTVLMRNLGTTISPFTAWLQLASLETLPLRMERHSSNGLAIARHLAAHPAVSWVAYPGLPGTSDRANADKCFTGRGYSGLLSFGVAAGRAAAADFVDALDLFADVTNIGDTKSLVTHSASTTHSQLSDAELRAAGVAPEAVRLSVGIEDVGDLVDDLDQALAHAG